MKITCLFGHKWNGCKCDRCGEIRDEGHSYTHFQPSATGKCVGTCKCGKQQELEHDWVGGKCARCGLRWDDTYEYAISMMDEKNYYEAYKCFERIEKAHLAVHMRLRRTTVLHKRMSTSVISSHKMITHILIM